MLPNAQTENKGCATGARRREYGERYSGRTYKTKKKKKMDEKKMEFAWTRAEWREAWVSPEVLGGIETPLGPFDKPLEQ